MLQGNPPADKSSRGGDKFSGKAIAVTQNVRYYHAMGSPVRRSSKHPEGGVWIHIYERIKHGSDTFRYFESFLFEDIDPKGNRKAGEQRSFNTG